MRVLTILALIGGLCRAQSELPQSVLDLAHIRAGVRESLERAPHYTCLETVARSHRPKGKTEFRPVDTLRLEVTRIGQQEFYSWPDASRFEGSAGDVVHAGTISTGEYSGHAASVFTNAATQIQFVGRESYQGRPALKYQYRIAAFASRWTLGFAGRSAIVASYGSFWADANTLDLIRLDSYADEIPPVLSILSASSQIDYAATKIGDATVVLPRSAQLRLGLADGEDRNVVEFSGCRPYSTQSEIRFTDEPRAAEPVAPASTPAITLAPDANVALELIRPIDSASSIEGDPIVARLAADVRLRRAIVVRKGAAVRGRICRLERYSDPVPHFVVGLEFTEIESGGTRWVFRGRLDRVDPIPGISWVLSTKEGQGYSGGPLGWSAQGIKGQTLYTADIPGVGTFFVEGGKFTLPAGFHMLWKTVDAR